jgi:hypothetical protein
MLHLPRITLLGASLTAALALTLAACGDDDDGDTTPTAAPASPTVAAETPAATATPAAEPAITIDEPAEGDVVTVPILMNGTANVFEAALTVDVLDDAGNELCIRHIMATSGTGTPGTWEAMLAIPPPDADALVTLRAYSFSAMDGSMINLVEREVGVLPEHPAIFITSPACGATVAPGGTIAVTGRAAVFEAALTVELRDASGAVVVAQNVMAASGVEESDFTAALAVPASAPNGMYDLVAYSHSAMDGSVINEFSIQILVEA